MDQRYQIVSDDSNHPLADSKELAAFLAKDGQLLLPMLDLVEQAQCAIDDLIDVMGRATVEAVLQMSAAQLAGPKQQGKRTDRDVVYHGTQKGRVALKERQLRIDKPRLRQRRRVDRESAGCLGSSGVCTKPPMTRISKQSVAGVEAQRSPQRNVASAHDRTRLIAHAANGPDSHAFSRVPLGPDCESRPVRSSVT